MPDRTAPLAPVAPALNIAGGVSAAITIVQRRSPSVPAVDRATAELVGKAATPQIEGIVMGVHQREMRPGGALYRAGSMQRA